MKRILIIIILVLTLTTSFVIWNNRTVSIITLDINPSIEIKLNKDNIVKDIIAKNDDAKKIINKDIIKKSLNNALEIIANNLINKDYAKDNKIEIIIYTNGKLTNKELDNKIKKVFETKNIYTEIIAIDNISKKDIEIAKKYNISYAKAAYINNIINENENVEIKNLINKPVNELTEVKNNGWYCNDGYSLEGSRCFKEIDRKVAEKSLVCPIGYYEYNNNCYEEVEIEESGNLVCQDDFVLKDNKCVRTLEEEKQAEYMCEKGELMRKGDVNPIGAPDNDKMYCIDKSNAKAPTLRCLTINHIMINGECYVGPAPVINGGCLNGDSLVNGGCYSKDDGDQYVCPNGSIYEKSKKTFVELCPDTFTYNNPIIKGYKCSDNFILKDDKCIKEESKDAFPEKICKEVYTLVNNARCINYNKTANKQDGYVCNYKNSELKNNMCIIYEIIDANKS